MIRLGAFFLAAVLCSAACESSDGNAVGFTPEECSAACQRISAAACGDIADGCFDACVHHAGVAETSECPTELRLYLDCFWPAESFVCDSESKTRATGCASQRDSYAACEAALTSGGAAGAAPQASSGESAGGASGSESGGASGAESGSADSGGAK